MNLDVRTTNTKLYLVITEKKKLITNKASVTHLTTAVLQQLPLPANPPLPSVLLQLAKKKTNTCPHGEPPPKELMQQKVTPYHPTEALISTQITV